MSKLVLNKLCEWLPTKHWDIQHSTLLSHRRLAVRLITHRWTPGSFLGGVTKRNDLPMVANGAISPVMKQPSQKTLQWSPLFDSRPSRYSKSSQFFFFFCLSPKYELIVKDHKHKNIIGKTLVTREKRNQMRENIIKLERKRNNAGRRPKAMTKINTCN